MDLINSSQDRRRREEAILPGEFQPTSTVCYFVPWLRRRFSNEFSCVSELLYLVAKFLDSSACKTSAKVCIICDGTVMCVLVASKHSRFPLFQVLFEEIRRLKVSTAHRGLPGDSRALVSRGFVYHCSKLMT